MNFSSNLDRVSENVEWTEKIMIDITIRCYAELNDHLLPEQRYTNFRISLPSILSIEELCNQLHIKSDEVDLVLVNGHSVDLTYQIKQDDYISIYPVFESIDIGSVTNVRDVPLRQVKFVLDVHLGKLARHLRLFGFDTLYQHDYSDDVLLNISLSQHRILLSRDASLMSNKLLTHAHLINNTNPRLQLIEVLKYFDLFNLCNPFSRCIECNSLLQPVPKEDIILRIPPLVKEWCNEYQICAPCDRIYWRGSHFQKMDIFVHEILVKKHEP